MSGCDLPAVVPGALIFSGLVLKQPHGMFASMRDKQRRFMELTMGDDLTPVLAYYEHPKLSDSVPKGVMFLDQRFEGFDVTTFELRREMEICSELSSTHEGAQSVGLGLPSDVHVVTDLLIGFESSIDHGVTPIG